MEEVLLINFKSGLLSAELLEDEVGVVEVLAGIIETVLGKLLLLKLLSFLRLDTFFSKLFTCFSTIAFSFLLSLTLAFKVLMVFWLVILQYSRL